MFYARAVNYTTLAFSLKNDRFYPCFSFTKGVFMELFFFFVLLPMIILHMAPAFTLPSFLFFVLLLIAVVLLLRM